MYVRRLTVIVTLSSLLLTLSLAPAALCSDALEQQQIKLLMSNYDAGNYAGAKETALRVISKNPTSQTAHYLLGNVYTKLGEQELARREYAYCCQNKANERDQVYQYAKQALLQLDSAAKTKEEKSASAGAAKENSAPAADPAPAPSGQVTERLKRFHDEGAQAIETKKRALENKIKTVEQEAADDINSVPQVNMQGMLNPFYESTVASIREAAKAKIVALSDTFENEKKKITESFDNQARDFEAAQKARTSLSKQTGH